jgi:hypothetical protein
MSTTRKARGQERAGISARFMPFFINDLEDETHCHRLAVLHAGTVSTRFMIIAAGAQDGASLDRRVIQKRDRARLLRDHQPSVASRAPARHSQRAGRVRRVRQRAAVAPRSNRGHDRPDATDGDMFVRR